MEATAHIPFIIAAYTAGIIVVGALIGWVIIDYRIQRRILAELETKGVSRRSVGAAVERTTSKDV
jgi:heme exporter protein D